MQKPARLLMMLVNLILLAAMSVQTVFATNENGNAAILSDANSLKHICQANTNEAIVRVHVKNIRYIEGNLRVQVYGANPDDFLAKGKKLLRHEVPVEDHEQTTCVALPLDGDYALVVMLDRNANGKADFFTEGFGFSRDPELNLAPPDHEETVFSVPLGVTDMTVTLKYILGGDEEKTKKRRKLRR